MARFGAEEQERGRKPFGQRMQDGIGGKDAAHDAPLHLVHVAHVKLAAVARPHGNEAILRQQHTGGARETKSASEGRGAHVPARVLW